MNKSIYKERFKTFLIVVLFLSTVLLSYFYWKDTSFASLKQSVDDRFSSSAFASAELPEVSSLVCPESVQVNFGDGTHCIYQQSSSELWSEFLSFYVDFSNLDNLVIEEISASQWNETMYLKSIEYVFDYAVPTEFLEMLGASNYGEQDYFSHFSSMAYSEASTSSVFIKDETTGRFFRIISDTPSDKLSKIIDELYQERTAQYYPISMLLGTENSSMMPFYTSYSLPGIAASENFSYKINDYEKDLAETFFGNSLDFVRKIVDDSGTITYMYGYGQRILTIYEDGSFEFQRTATSEETSASADDAFEAALSFIANHGSWISYNGSLLDTRLESISEEDSGKSTVYTFTFAMKYDNLSLYRTDNSEITIEVTGNQVTNYTRNVYMTNPVEVSETDSGDTSHDLSNKSVMNILSDNYQTIAQVLTKNDLLSYRESSMDIFDVTISSITSIKLGYLSQNSVTDSSNSFVPVWVVDFSGLSFFFDLYGGDYLGYTSDI